MKPISSRKELIESLKDLKAMEAVARDEYKEDLYLYDNKEIKEKIRKIELDEEKHISIIDLLIKMLIKK